MSLPLSKEAAEMVAYLKQHGKTTSFREIGEMFGVKGENVRWHWNRLNRKPDFNKLLNSVFKLENMIKE